MLSVLSDKSDGDSRRDQARKAYRQAGKRIPRGGRGGVQPHRCLQQGNLCGFRHELFQRTHRQAQRNVLPSYHGRQLRLRREYSLEARRGEARRTDQDVRRKPRQ